MTQEQKQLLLKDLSARLPYGIIYHRIDGANIKLKEIDINRGYLNYTDDIDKMELKPYLRPMDSMTPAEKEEYHALYAYVNGCYFPLCPWENTDFLNKNHFDYRGLIPMGLALEATKDMYEK